MKLHESFVRQALEGRHGELDWRQLKSFHDEQVSRMQHERLVHLVVTLFMGLFLLLVLGFIMINPSWPTLGLVVLLLGLVSAYIMHYFRLENGIQRWYHLGNDILTRTGAPGARYDRGRVEIPDERPEPGSTASL